MMAGKSRLNDAERFIPAALGNLVAKALPALCACLTSTLVQAAVRCRSVMNEVLTVQPNANQGTPQ